MARRVANTRRTSTDTNGQLVRLYVREWRSEPVGKVKRALRKEIAEWARATEMEDSDNPASETEPDVDAIRYVNQFGTPQVPVIEIACVPEKFDLVSKFLQENFISMWPDINPFWEQSVDPIDTYQDSKRYRITNFTRVLVAWWKAANFV